MNFLYVKYDKSSFINLLNRVIIKMVPKAGLEPARGLILAGF